MFLNFMSLENPVLSSDSTGNIKFMYIQLFHCPCFDI